MLVLQRKKSETIRINDDIIVTLVRTKGDSAYIGIDAPESVAIHRGEVYDAIKTKGQDIHQRTQESTHD